MDFKQVFDVYASTKEGKRIEYKEYSPFDEMIKIVVKSDRNNQKLSRTSKQIEKELAEAFPKRNEEKSKATILIEQSEKYQTPQEAETRKKKIEEIKKLEDTMRKKPESLKIDNVMKYLDSYEGKYAIQEVKNRDKANLNSLRNKAINVEEEYPAETNQTQESSKSIANEQDGKEEAK